MRLILLLSAALLAGCAPAPAPTDPTKIDPPRIDPTVASWYGEATDQLTALNQEAQGLLRSGKSDEAAAVITKAQAVQLRLLAAPRPTLAATEAASDLDHLYGGMLITNRHYGWARLLFQKDMVRWKNWKPQTADSERRRKLAESRLAECDRLLGQ